LIRFYGTALSEYAKDNEIPEDLITFQSVRGQPGATHLNVHAKVHQPNGTDVQVGYKLYLVNGTWKIVDIRVAGVSMVATYRSSFAREIRRGGLDRLIQKLAERNKTALGV
jgi:phospholipid transport system substrate-binding protein